jgi:hypothetical protein
VHELSETSGTFGKLWVDHPKHLRSVFEHYRRRVYALEHPTLAVSPIENAFTLAQACPKGARLHVVSHSRGGLVAEVLARVCARPGLNARDYAFFKGADYRRQRETLKALGKVVAERKLRVERIVRVACPSRGTLLASKRLDAYVSILKWTLELASVPVAPAIVDFLGEVAQRRADPELLPGLAEQIPDSPLVRWLNAADEPIAGDLRVVAGDIEGDSVISWLKALLADAFYWTENDLVVQTGSMYGGVPRHQRDFPVGSRREGFALQLLSQRAHRGCYRQCTGEAEASWISGDRTAVVGWLVAHRHPRSLLACGRRCAGKR